VAGRETDREHPPSRAQRRIAVSAAVAVGLTTWIVLRGIIGVVSLLISTSLGHRRWMAGDVPVGLDIVRVLTVLLILAAAIQAGRAAHRAMLRLLSQNDGNDS
jgi:hypothetical protein